MVGLVTENTALNSSTSGLAANNYFQEQSRTVMCNEEIDMMASPKVVTIWRQAEETAEENVPFVLHYSDTLSLSEVSL